jgi:uncharacterized protein
MIATFYRKFSLHLLALVLLSFPYLTFLADSLPSNNDIETWLPRESEVRANYEAFKAEFGAEEIVLIGIAEHASDDRLVEALCARIERRPEIRKCWSPERLKAVMQEFGVSHQNADERLTGLAVSESGKLVGLIALLSEAGLNDRASTVAGIRQDLRYCQLHGDDAHLAGAPVVVAELDRLGSQENNRAFFLITLFICLCLLYYSIRQWKLTLAILGLTVWAINLTQAIIHLAGGEMNFILGALSVMVMVFTLAISIHVLHYFEASHASEDRLSAALRLAGKPCGLATLTTVIGLLSLTVSDIAPVKQFGYGAALGSLVALLTGLGLTPAVLTIWPHRPVGPHYSAGVFTHTATWLLARSKAVALITGGMVLFTCAGLFSLETKIEPLDFLPRDSKILADVLRIESDLTNSESIEAVVDFDDYDLTFVEKLEKVREFEACIARHPSVRHTMSLATFFPKEMPDSPLAAARILGKANASQGESDFISDGERYWRISARITPRPDVAKNQTFLELQEMTTGLPITLTGIAPLLQQAQREIFEGFWESFAMAFVIITIVMIISLRSLKAGLIAMIPNLTPICIVFGSLGWLHYPVDIGMMMTGSIALGIAVDGTFHFLVRYQDYYRRTGDSPWSSKNALLQTGLPIFKAAVVTGIGMLALTMSSFAPTARFGLLMTMLLFAAVIGDLILLPALLTLRPGSTRNHRPPHFEQGAIREQVSRDLHTARADSIR